MIILKPFAHETIWGGTRLCGYADGCHDRIGHLYSLYDNEISNCIANGKYQGRTLHDYFMENRERYGLESFGHFPIVLAIVEAADNLSIQVHPDDYCARRMEHVPWGKNESWYFINAPISGKIYAGCNFTGKKEVERLLLCGKGNEIASSVDVMEDDYIYIQAGTLHAMTAGSLVYEIEENSEFTYRLYDYDREDEQGNRRELHIEKALEALKPELKPSARRYGDEICERMYSTRLIEECGDYRNRSGMLECVTFLSDPQELCMEGVRIRFGTSIILEPGEVLPAAANKIMIARVKGKEGL